MNLKSLSRPLLQRTQASEIDHHVSHLLQPLLLRLPVLLKTMTRGSQMSSKPQRCQSIGIPILNSEKAVKVVNPEICTMLMTTQPHLLIRQGLLPPNSHRHVRVHLLLLVDGPLIPTIFLSIRYVIPTLYVLVDVHACIVLFVSGAVSGSIVI
jgi:hypothetical protein